MSNLFSLVGIPSTGINSGRYLVYIGMASYYIGEVYTGYIGYTHYKYHSTNMFRISLM
jgi:hypothetical protein